MLVPVRPAREGPESAPSAVPSPEVRGGRGARERPVGCAFPPKAHPGRRGALTTPGPGHAPGSGPYPKAAALLAGCSDAMSRETASMRARWVNACGKLPICSPVLVSISSAYS